EEHRQSLERTAHTTRSFRLLSFPTREFVAKTRRRPNGWRRWKGGGRCPAQRRDSTPDRSDCTCLFRRVRLVDVSTRQSALLERRCRLSAALSVGGIALVI